MFDGQGRVVDAVVMRSSTSELVDTVRGRTADVAEAVARVMDEVAATRLRLARRASPADRARLEALAARASSFAESERVEAEKLRADRHVRRTRTAQ
jgi:hypothetical protein